jgi:hypothetical protein
VVADSVREEWPSRFEVSLVTEVVVVFVGSYGDGDSISVVAMPFESPWRGFSTLEEGCSAIALCNRYSSKQRFLQSDLQPDTLSQEIREGQVLAVPLPPSERSSSTTQKTQQDKSFNLSLSSLHRLVERGGFAMADSLISVMSSQYNSQPRSIYPGWLLIVKSRVSCLEIDGFLDDNYAQFFIGGEVPVEDL